MVTETTPSDYTTLCNLQVDDRTKDQINHLQIRFRTLVNFVLFHKEVEIAAKSVYETALSKTKGWNKI